MALRTLSICAGVGGLDLGVRIARPDARCVAFVEREASAAASLVASMEAGRLHPAAVWSDLRTFDAGAWRGAVDCVLSGDPCQGNSVAGKRLGADDDRWLLDRAIEVFDQSGAHTFFRENVPGNLDGQLAVAVPSLERLGCRIACGIFSAAEAEASHRRERFFLLAHRDGAGLPQRLGRGEILERSLWREGSPPVEDGRGGLAGGTLVHPQSKRRGEGRPEHAGQQGRSAAASTGGALGNSICSGDGGITVDARGARSNELLLTGQAEELAKVVRAFATTDLLLPDRPTPFGEKSSETRRRLNPLFVEWLMGWPQGLSGFDTAGTASCRSPQPSPGCDCMDCWLNRQREALAQLLAIVPAQALLI